MISLRFEPQGTKLISNMAYSSRKQDENRVMSKITEVFKQFKHRAILLLSSDELTDLVDSLAYCEYLDYRNALLSEYSRMLAWSESASKMSREYVRQLAFQKIHQEVFRNEIELNAKLMSVRQNALKKQLDLSEEDYLKKETSLANTLKEQVAIEQQLTVIANNININNYKRYQEQINQLSSGLKKHPHYGDYTFRADKLITKHLRNGAVDLLDKQINLYRNTLKNESWFRKFFAYLGFSRYKRLQALKAYDLKVKSVQDVESRYHAAAAWLKIVKNDSDYAVPTTSRFFNMVLQPLTKPFDAAPFEAIGYIYVMNQVNLRKKKESYIEKEKQHNSKILSLNFKIRETYTRNTQAVFRLNVSCNGFTNSPPTPLLRPIPAQDLPKAKKTTNHASAGGGSPVKPTGNLMDDCIKQDSRGIQPKTPTKGYSFFSWFSTPSQEKMNLPQYNEEPLQTIACHMQLKGV